MQTLTVIVADTHTNSRAGLVKPGAEYEGGAVQLSRGQRWLWSCWLDFCERVQSHKLPTLIHFNGDIGELDYKMRTASVYSRNPAMVQRLALETIDPLAELADWLVFERGTPAHSGQDSWIEEALGRNYDHTQKSPAGDFSWMYWRGRVEGVGMDIRHHGRVGRLPHTRANPLGQIAIKTHLADPRVDLAIRSHVHKFADSYDNYPVRVINTGAWQLMTAYGSRVSEEPSDIGGVLIFCDGGKYEVEKVEYKPRKERLWTIPIPKATARKT